MKKEILIAQIIEERVTKSSIGTHCSNCGHCTATL